MLKNKILEFYQYSRYMHRTNVAIQLPISLYWTYILVCYIKPNIVGLFIILKYIYWRSTQHMYINLILIKFPQVVSCIDVLYHLWV